MHRQRFFLFMFVLALLSCSEDPRMAIIGAWKADTGVQTLHFFPDGYAEIEDHKLNRRYEGDCSFSRADELRCQYDGFSFEVIRTVSISGNTLTLESPGGQQERYRRVEP